VNKAGALENPAKHTGIIPSGRGVEVAKLFGLEIVLHLDEVQNGAPGSNLPKPAIEVEVPGLSPPRDRDPTRC
jgi:hypothetical protein